MSGENQKDDFNARLARIRNQRGTDAAGAAPPPGPPRRPAPASGPRRRGLDPALKGALWGVALLAAAGGLYAGGKILGGVDLPLSRISGAVLGKVAATTPGSDRYDGLIGSRPKARKHTDTGWELPSPYVAAPGSDGELTLAEIAVTPGARPGQPDPAPEVRQFAANTRCTLRRPRAGEVVRNVRLSEPARYTRIHLFSDAELAKAVSDRIEGITRGPQHYKNAAIARGRMGLVDVFVTDTSAPVYLVLQSFDKDVLWNIHLAPGVTLGHVAMIGNKSGFAAPPGDYGFEALRIRDFVPGKTFTRNRTIRDCMIAPFRKPQPDWPIRAKLANTRDGDIYREVLRAKTEGHAAFAVWYRKTLGVDPAANLTGAVSAAHVLAGPRPDRPVTLSPLGGRVLHVTRADHIAFGNEQLQAVHRRLLLAAAGGDLSTLTPSPVAATPQEVTQ